MTLTTFYYILKSLLKSTLDPSTPKAQSRIGLQRILGTSAVPKIILMIKIMIYVILTDK